MADRLSVLARSWIGGKISGESSQMSLVDMKRSFYLQQLGTNARAGSTVGDMEKQWLRKWIGENGGTATGRNNSDLWKQAVAVLGQPVGSSQSVNQSTFYRHAS